MPPVKTQAEHEQQEQRTKLANSYQSLLTEFSSADLHTVGNYSVGRLIGKGSFGKVYLASHKLTNGSKVVLKSADKNDPNLAREIHHHRQFLHPHIARLYEVIVTENLVWLVLEWCPGDELYNYISVHGRMEAAKVQKIFTQLVGAVSYVHNKSCVHRDLKLENILLDKNENVKLVDFGFTREYQGTTSYLQTWCGTVCYSAPEMLKGEKYAGEKVDVWSLGIILYALLCGELPYDEDDDSVTKAKILKEEPTYPEHIPEGAKDLMKKLLSKRPILRPTLADVLKDPWLSEHAPQQQEILKLQQPAPFSTPLEKDTLQRMRSAGVDIDMVIEHVLAQRCDSLAGWWALLIEKEQRKEKRRERKRKEKDAEAKSLRRLSAASSKLLALGEIHEGEIFASPASRGRRMTRANGSAETPLPKVAESATPEGKKSSSTAVAKNVGGNNTSPDRPPPPPKDYTTNVVRRTRNNSRSSGNVLRVVTTNSDLLSPQYIPPPQRKRRALIQQPLKEQIAWVKHFFKEGPHRRGKSPNETSTTAVVNTPTIVTNGPGPSEHGKIAGLQKAQTGPLPDPPKRISFDEPPDLQARTSLAARPRISTASTVESRATIQRKRQSLSPGSLTPHSSVRRSSAGLRGRKSTSSSVSSIRSAYQPTHQHTLSKTSSTSSTSMASPTGLSSTSGSRLGRSPHSSVKVLPPTPTGGTFPSSIRVSRRPPVSSLGPLPTFNESKPFTNVAPSSPGLPVFARRKRSVFKGPGGLGGSPSSFTRTAMNGLPRSGSVSRKSTEVGEMIPGITEEDEEEEEEEEEDEGDEVEDEDVGAEGDLAEIVNLDRFASQLPASGVVDTDSKSARPDPYLPATPVSPSPVGYDVPDPIGSTNVSPKTGMGTGTPLTAEALAQMQEEEERSAAAAAAALAIVGGGGGGGSPSPVMPSSSEKK